MSELDRIDKEKQRLALISDMQRATLHIEIQSVYPFSGVVANSANLLMSAHKLWRIVKDGGM